MTTDRNDVIGLPIRHARRTVRTRADEGGVSVRSPALAPVVYEYLNRVADPNVGAAGDDHRSWVDPSVYVDDYGTELVDRLLAGEQYPGEAFEAVLAPSPETVVPAFIDDVAVHPDDVVGFAAPSTQLYDDLFYTVCAAMAESSAVLTTKYPRQWVCSRLPTLDPVVVDATPGARADGGVDASTAETRPVRCGDLTSLGVAAERATTRLATDERTGTFALATMTQLLAHHDPSALDRFLHELVGQWRNRDVGGLVHVPPADDADGDDWFGSAHFDYVIEIRTGPDGIQARVVGKRDVSPSWRAIGVTPCSDAERSVRTTDRGSSETDREEEDVPTPGNGA